MNRSKILAWHRRIALVFAPLLLLQALTGAALVFKEPLARSINPAAMARQTADGTVPVSRLLASANTLEPGYHVVRLFMPPGERDVAFAHLANAAGAMEYASLDPGDGKVLAHGNVWHFPLEAALQLHYHLMDGRVGLAVVLANGLALACLAVTGLLSWRPGKGRIMRSLAVRRDIPARLRLRQWHRSGGVVASIVLVFSATTGVLLVLPDLAPSGQAAQASSAAYYTSEQVDRAIARAQTRFPTAAMRDIRFPPADRLDVNFSAPERNPHAVHVVSIAPGEGRVLQTIPADDNPVLWMKVLSLHTGDSFGLGGRLLLLAGATTLAFLCLSGPYMWWRARRPKRKA